MVVEDTGLIGHWPLAGDTQDASGHGHDGINRGADLTAAGPDGRASGAARFDGRTAAIEVAASDALRLGTGDFSISVWVHTAQVLDDVLGDIVSKYDPDRRRGFNFSIQNYAGVTSHQANWRNVHFGIDNAQTEPAWTDCGRPGNNLRVYALCVYDGNLYAGTFETGADEAGHLYRYAGGTEWVDCGSPDRCNTVAALAIYEGRLYAGVSRYRAGGSALPESLNQHPGGRIYRYEADGSWTDCGHLEGADSIAGLTVYKGQLYAIPLYSQGVFRYAGGQRWVDCGTPGRRLMSLAVYNGHLYATGNEGGGLFRYAGGTEWTNCGYQADTTQVYSVAIHGGRLYTGTWPTGTVFRWDGQTEWANTGRLGEELEVMGMAVYNGKLYAGTLPLANVYRYDGDGAWVSTGQLDATPAVKYRRVWSMAVYQGRLFGGTLPSGHVYSLEAGRNVTHDRELAPGWRHLVAVRERSRLRLYVDGEPVATSAPFQAADYDLSNEQPLRIGMGAHDHFCGRMADLRLYGRALTDGEVARLSRRVAAE